MAVKGNTPVNYALVWAHTYKTGVTPSLVKGPAHGRSRLASPKVEAAVDAAGNDNVA